MWNLGWVDFQDVEACISGELLTHWSKFYETVYNDKSNDYQTDSLATHGIGCCLGEGHGNWNSLYIFSSYVKKYLQFNNKNCTKR